MRGINLNGGRPPCFSRGTRKSGPEKGKKRKCRWHLKQNKAVNL